METSLAFRNQDYRLYDTKLSGFIIWKFSNEVKLQKSSFFRVKNFTDKFVQESQALLWSKRLGFRFYLGKSVIGYLGHVKVGISYYVKYRQKKEMGMVLSKELKLRPTKGLRKATELRFRSKDKLYIKWNK